MKLAFSTIGCPNWSYDEVVSTASDLGYDGFEVRGIGGEIYAPDVKQFKPENIEKTKEKGRCNQDCEPHGTCRRDELRKVCGSNEHEAI